MPYDEALAERIRDLLTGAHSDGRLMVHADKEQSVAFATEPGANLMERGGKGMKGWLLVDADAVEDEAALELWVGRGRDHAQSMPPK